MKKTRSKIIDMIRRDGHEVVLMDGFDDCIVGLVTRFGFHPVVCYDREKVIKKLMRSALPRMTREDAVEWHEVNQAGALWGEMTPCFISYRLERGRP